MILFSIVIPTYNRIELLTNCLDHVIDALSVVDSKTYEIIVSDDNFRKENSENLLTRYAPFSYLRGPGRGPAANRNNGASHAKGKWLVFLDDDCKPDRNLFKSYSNAITTYPKSLAFEGAIFPEDWDLVAKDMSDCPINTTGKCFWSANIMVEKSFFFDIGGFDERFTIAAQEDQDFYIRCKELTEVPFLLSAIVFHPVKIASLFQKIREIHPRMLSWLIFRHKYGFNIWSNYIHFLRSQLVASYKSLKNRTFLRLAEHVLTFSYGLFFLPLISSKIYRS